MAARLHLIALTMVTFAGPACSVCSPNCPASALCNLLNSMRLPFLAIGSSPNSSISCKNPTSQIGFLVEELH